LGYQLQAKSHRQCLEPSLTLCPFDEIPTLRVLQLEEIRHLIEVPVEQAGDIIAVTEGLLEQSKERDLPL